MRRILFGLGAVALAALTSGCGAYYERSYAYAPPGTVYYGDAYYPSGYRYYTPTYYYGLRDYKGIHVPDELRTM